LAPGIYFRLLLVGNFEGIDYERGIASRAVDSLGLRRFLAELFEQLRREYTHGVGTIQGALRKLKAHRRIVRQALESAIPTERKRPVRRKPKLGR
jgi:hypothetical protein